MTAYYQQVLNGAYDNHVLPFLSVSYTHLTLPTTY